MHLITLHTMTRRIPKRERQLQTNVKFFADIRPKGVQVSTQNSCFVKFLCKHILDCIFQLAVSARNSLASMLRSIRMQRSEFTTDSIIPASLSLVLWHFWFLLRWSKIEFYSPLYLSSLLFIRLMMSKLLHRNTRTRIEENMLLLCLMHFYH